MDIFVNPDSAVEPGTSGANAVAATSLVLNKPTGVEGGDPGAHVEDATGPAPDTTGDLRMLCYVRGRDRTLEQLGQLAEPDRRDDVAVIAVRFG